MDIEMLITVAPGQGVPPICMPSPAMEPRHPLHLPCKQHNLAAASLSALWDERSRGTQN